jgi:hypothetical protein
MFEHHHSLIFFLKRNWESDKRFNICTSQLIFCEEKAVCLRNSLCMFSSEPYPLVEEENTTTILRERFDSSQVRSKSRSSRQTKESNTTAEPQLVAPPPPPLSKDPSLSSDIAGSSEPNPSAWHFASDAPTVANNTASNGQQPAIGVVAAGQRTPPPASGAKVLETSLPKGSFLTSSLCKT